MKRNVRINAAGWVMAVLLLAGCSGGGDGDGGDGGTTALTDAEIVTENNRAVGLMGKFQYSEAHAIFEALHAATPENHELTVNLAIATLNRQQEGDEPSALAMLESVLAADPDHARANYCAGLLKLYQGPPADPLPHFQAANAADPDDAYTIYLLGRCYEQNREFAQSLVYYEQAMERDPYLASAILGASRGQRMQGEVEAANAGHVQFERMKENPRSHLFEFKYTRMGALADTVAFDVAERTPNPKPGGALFADPVALPITNSADLTWTNPGGRHPVSITACDLDHDGDLDLFFAGTLIVGSQQRNAVLINDGAGSFTAALDHPLALVADVNAALWGDYDNDGRTDVYLCRLGENQLWQQGEDGSWTDVTASTMTGNGPLDTVDGALFDADHDGDLDLFCVNADGPNELLNNNLDGTFRAIAQERGIAGSGPGSRQVLVTDLDQDRDADIIVINDQPPHEVYLNDRLWEYHAAEGFDEFIVAQAHAVVAVDLDADGSVELLTSPNGLGPFVWRRDGEGVWRKDRRRGLDIASGDGQLWSVDLDGDGALELFTWSYVWNPEGALASLDGFYEYGYEFRGTAMVNLQPGRGPSMIALVTDDPPQIWNPGPGRHDFATLTFSGRKDKETMRSNASGIGAEYAVRVDSQWTIGSTFRNGSGPGQSLQPVAIGLGGHERIDFVAMEWSDGVFQSEVGLAAGVRHDIVETQRQLSSCPVLFAWNGERFEFVSDLLGVGGMGYLVAPGEYAPPRPWEQFMLPAGALAPKDGRYLLKLAEPMEEACYLDSATLAVYDVPAGWKLTVDDRMSILGPEPTGNVLLYRDELSPVRAVNERGEDETTAVMHADLVAPDVGPLDHRFIGRLAGEFVLTLEFDQPLDDHEGAPILVIDGWVEYPYSQTMFAAWQAGATYDAPTLEARNAEGEWVVVHEQFGYPAGMPRQMSIGLPTLPAGTTALRLRTNQEIYWDRIVVAWAEPCVELSTQRMPARKAGLESVGFPLRTTGGQRTPDYDYARRAPFWDTRHQSGYYTGFGPVTPLLEKADNAVAIFGPGEAIHLEFDVPPPSRSTDSTRVFVLSTVGWCKDMDLYTKDGETIGPLPRGLVPDGANTDQRDALHDRYNTRYRSGR